MAAEKNPKAASELSQLDRLQNWYEANGKMVNIAVLSILAIILLLIAYTNIYKPKRETAAQDAIFKAQHWFEQDSIAKALNDPSNGFLEVASSYGSTKAGNLAKYYAGLSYYQLADYPNAEKYLTNFCPKHDEVLGGLAIATLADAQMENGKQDAALKNYKKAASFSDNEASAPFLLLKAGLAYDYAGKGKEAVELFKQLEANYPNSTEASDAIKYLAKVEASM
ncbi:MAG: putative negative regulator of RcsB-dependent stress response [Chitinophagales bacterium]|jgi:predicted negative regulator of RcsB-dependent stress response